MPDKNGNIRRAVVLAGGGSKGAYEVGAWQAMEELSLPYHVVTGTSIGALNGALMVQGDLEEALHLWRHMDSSQVVAEAPVPTADLAGLRDVYYAFLKQMVGKGGLDTTPLEDVVRRLLDEDLIRRSPIEFGLVTVELRSMKPIERFLPEIPKGQLADFLLASAAFFPAFKPRSIDEGLYIDGGYSNNMPIDLALKANQKVDEIIAVDVNGIGRVRQFDPGIPMTIVRCYWDLGNVLIFDSMRCRRSIRLGYLDGMKALGSYGGQAYTFDTGEAQRLDRLHLAPVSRVCLGVLNALSGDGQSQIGSLMASRIIKAATRKRSIDSGDARLHDLLLASAELAGELLELSPTTLYTAATFDRAIRESFLVMSADVGEAIAPLRQRGEVNLRALISGIKKEHLLILASELVHRQLTGSDSILQLELLATLLPKELLAAIYIEALLY
ncbi:MAG: patatin-like phospholipase family protein [Angelakisella sp.]